MEESKKKKKRNDVVGNFFRKGIDISKFSTRKKYALLMLFCVYIITCVGIFFNWISLSDFFYHGNVYINDCKSVRSGGRKNWEGKSYSCEEQDKRVQALYPIILCSNFIMSAISGVFFDYFGPKITALIGHTFNIISWILIGLQKEGKNNTIIFGAIFLGLSCDSSYIPILSLIYLFEENHTMYTVILGCCASLSFSMPIFLDMFTSPNDPQSFQLICLLYCAIILVPFFFVLLIFLPLKHISGGEPVAEEAQGSHNQTLQALEGFVVSGVESPTDRSVRSMSNRPVCSPKYEHELEGENNTLRELMIERALTSSSFSISSANGCVLRRVGTQTSSNFTHREEGSNDVFSRKGGSSLIMDGGYARSSSAQGGISNQNEVIHLDEKLNGNVEHKNSCNVTPPQCSETGTNFFSIRYLSICYYFTIYNLSLVNYNECAKLFFADYADVQGVLKIFGPLSVISCAAFGFLIRKFHILVIILSLLMSSLFMYFFAVMRGKLFAYLSTLFYLIVTGCYTTQLYCYIQLMFPKRHFGKIAGTTSMISGLLSLLNIPIYNYFIVDYSKSDPNPFAYVVIALLASTSPLLLLTYRRATRGAASA
ncbi:transporter, putative [Plasmodium vivax]|uniref:Transporter, putative n=4 Tax=Plasmodium vivax TaxID=5855 RepID=A5K9W4_PLAVS|nr:transporter, putative [Plasmodium vivax]EDL43852.1 transporter, putative [Plasmodium vivax]KMZ89251.1 hypothetical protein PVBG_03601 [Plasmodium vivax Brazil I]KMZ95573.1 hypothetical protein PVMG_04366 [Plasmodium vivax Mauritania I]KNA02037.1 hypothetical protein PVNG_04151 [Plasmodium vivax North Korean]|eukprot:XP_001613579.1 transporter [Plasmodium vivax Sal-1]